MFGFVSFPQKQTIFDYINGHRKQYIQADIIFNYMFHFGLPGTCLHLSPQNTASWRRRSQRQKGVFSLSGTGGASLRKVYFAYFSEDFLKSNMKHVVKYN